ncbi:MAG: Hsp70 family protein [Phycisphaerales bacterium]
MDPSSTIVGIDLGTTNSLVAVCDAAGPRVIRGKEGEALVPSAVRYERAADGTLRALVGAAVKREAPDHAERTVLSVKRLMGRSLDDARADLPYLSYAVRAGERGTSRVALRFDDGSEAEVTPEEVSAQILRELKDRASAHLGFEVTRAVVTVPAYFDDAQRQATRVAGRLAGLDVVRIVPEPTAAALAYGLGLDRAHERSRESARVVAVYDLGGGTFDVSVLRLTPAASDGDRSFFEVLATSGDTRLGGDDFDFLLADLIRRELNAALGAPAEAPLPPGVRRSVMAMAEGIKVRLSEHEHALVRIDLGPRGTFERTVSRAEFEALISPLVDRTIASCAAARRDASARAGVSAIDTVVMVGGSTRVPLVRRRVEEYFGLEPYTAIDPDEVVALGAAVQGAVLGGTQRGALLLDVIPLSLGVETVGGAVAKLIVRNSTVPARAKEMFSTSVDGQTSIKLAVYQGEREMTADCRLLGEFHLRGIPPMPAGIPQLEVSFAVDANGVLNVSAHERRSGKRASLQVVPNHGLTGDEVERIERDSVANAREDMVRHRVADLLANSRLDLKWISERLDRHGAKLDPAYRVELESKVAHLRTLVERAGADWRSVDPNQMHRAKEDLDVSSVRLQEVSITESLRS